MVISWAVAAGATSSANTSSTPVICAVAATVTPSTSRNPHAEPAHRHPAGAGHRLVHGGEQQRSPGHHEEHAA